MVFQNSKKDTQIYLFLPKPIYFLQRNTLFDCKQMHEHKLTNGNREEPLSQKRINTYMKDLLKDGRDLAHDSE